MLRPKTEVLTSSLLSKPTRSVREVWLVRKAAADWAVSEARSLHPPSFLPAACACATAQRGSFPVYINSWMVRVDDIVDALLVYLRYEGAHVSEGNAESCNSILTNTVLHIAGP